MNIIFDMEKATPVIIHNMCGQFPGLVWLDIASSLSLFPRIICSDYPMNNRILETLMTTKNTIVVINRLFRDATRYHQDWLESVMSHDLSIDTQKTLWETQKSAMITKRMISKTARTICHHSRPSSKNTGGVISLTTSIGLATTGMTV